MYGSIATLISYYIIGLPLSVYLAFNCNGGLYGLWLGFTIANMILDIGFTIIIVYPDWQQIAFKLQNINVPE
jgi:MATE family multidrug resistance protein